MTVASVFAEEMTRHQPPLQERPPLKPESSNSLTKAESDLLSTLPPNCQLCGCRLRHSAGFSANILASPSSENRPSCALLKARQLGRYRRQHFPWRPGKRLPPFGRSIDVQEVPRHDPPKRAHQGTSRKPVSKNLRAAALFWPVLTHFDQGDGGNGWPRCEPRMRRSLTSERPYSSEGRGPMQLAIKQPGIGRQNECDPHRRLRPTTRAGMQNPAKT